jgi:anti-anti-sigma factor
VTGEVDLASAEELERKLARWCETCRGPVIEVDCSRLGFIDSSGFRVLFDAAEQLAKEDRRLVVANLPATSRRAAEIIGLGAVLVLR